MKFKMKGGTAQGDENLCATCRAGQTVRAAKSNHTVTRCHRLDRDIHEPIAECSDYDDKREPSLSAMKLIAWPITSDKKGRSAGFMSPAEYDKAVKDGKVEDNRNDAIVLPDGGVYW